MRMCHMYGGTALIVLAAISVAAVAYDDAWADQHMVTYRVVAHDPVCVAIYVEAMEEVTRITPLRERYDRSETLAGVPILIQVPESRALDTVQSLLERRLVHSVQRVGTFWNGSHTVEWPPEINPDADASKSTSHCYHIDSNLAVHLRNAIIQRDGGALAASGESQKMVNVYIFPSNLTSMKAYLEENGATIMSAYASREYKGSTLGPQINARIPYSIIPSLVERDDFAQMETIHLPMLLGHGGTSGGFGTTHTEGLSLHEHAEEWHAAGYTGAGITVGVIDIQFDGIEDAQNNGELPRTITLHCNGPTTTLSQCQTGTPNSNNTHGTSVAEIVMDMAPDARLVIGLVNGNYTVYNITDWMTKQDVDVIVASISPLVFEGPGDGTSPYMETSLNAIDLAVSHNVTWVNAAGNSNDDNTWYRINPSTIRGGILNLEWRIPFGATQTENPVTVYPNRPLSVVLRWDGPWHDPTNRPVDLDLHLECQTAVLGVWWDVARGTLDQDTMTFPKPIESLNYSNTNSTNCRVVIKSPDGDVSGQIGWVQIMSNYGEFAFNTRHTVGAVDGNKDPIDYISTGPTFTHTGSVSAHVPFSFLDTLSRADNVVHIEQMYTLTHTNGTDSVESGQNDAPVRLIVTTHNPPCTAIFMYGHDGAILQTNLQPLPLFSGYAQAELKAGVDVTYTVPAHRADELLSALSERREVSSAAAYLAPDIVGLLAGRPASMFEPASKPSSPLASVTGPDRLGTSILDITKCDSRLDGVLYNIAYNVVLHDLGPPASEEVVWVIISTGDSNAEALAFMRQHGIMIQSVSESTPTRVGGITAHVPILLLGKLSEVDHVEYVEQMLLIRTGQK